MEEADGILDIGAGVALIVQADDVLAEEAVQTVGKDELLDCLLGFLVGFHIVFLSLCGSPKSCQEGVDFLVNLVYYNFGVRIALCLRFLRCGAFLFAGFDFD